MNNLFLFTGEESYLLHQELKRWQQGFKQKHGEFNLQIIDGKEATAGEIITQISTLPFLSEKRLILIEDLPEAAPQKEDSSAAAEKKSEKDPLEPLFTYLPQIPDTSVVVFIQQKPDRRKSFYKALAKVAEIKNFNPLEGAALEQWVRQQIIHHKGQIENSAVSYLISLTGGDLWRLSNEIKKLVTHQNGLKIDKAAIDQLVVPTLEANIFHLTDALGSGSGKQAIWELHRSMSAGTPLRQVFYMIVRQFRLFLQIKSYLETHPLIQSTAMASELKIHPFVAKNSQSQVRHFNLSQLKTAYAKLLKIDIDLKSSQIKVTTENQGELALALERFIVDFCHKG